MLALPGPLFDIRSGILVDGVCLRFIPNESVAGTGGSFWDASVILVKYLEENRELIRGKVVLELGAGLGVSSIGSKILGANRVIATDLLDVLIGMRMNIESNQVDIECAELDWFNPHTIDAEIIILADVVWIRELIKPLVLTLKMQLNHSNFAIICNKIRSRPIHREFKSELKCANIVKRKLKAEYDYKIWELKLSSE